MKAKFFMFLPVLLLGLSLGGWAVMISMATSDPSFSVEPAYYRKAARYDEELARRRQSAKLGWQVEVISFQRTSDGRLALDVQVSDRAGAPLGGVDLRVEALSNLRGADLHEGAQRTGADGRAKFELEPGAPGLWELRFRAVRGPDEFVQVARADLVGEGGKT